ncbi:hypothetical protein KKF61_03760 [Patescibacteria group bacterium]|nr:hypothetical protein [Patescibacteria group bacterium]MBU0964542.1 hypothetical protein [Patescibacteria group bacterium]
MKTLIIIIIVLGLVGGLAYVIISYANNEQENANSFTVSEVVSGSADIQIKKSADKNLAIAKAKELWRLKFAMDEDLSNGPCLSNNVIKDWVADIAHSPRQAVDDLPENQCSAFRGGTAKHFVELDLSGELIRAE